MPETLTPPAYQSLLRQGMRIEIFTLIYMTLEAVLSIGAGVAAGSALLAAFGIDSLIELLSGGILLWRLRVEAGSRDTQRIEDAEKRAAWGTTIVLGLLCVYILFTSLYGLLFHTHTESSPLGIGVSLAAMVLMPFLAATKKKIAAGLHSSALAEDAVASLTCAYMAGTVLVGLVLNTLAGWWWAEDIAGLAFLFWLARETWEAFSEAKEHAE